MVNITRWNPRNEIEVTDPFRSMEQLMDNMWRNMVGRYESDTSRALLRPAMDVVESQNEIMVKLDLPGIDPDRVNVQVENFILTISGEFEDQKTQDGDRYHYRERSFGSFQRSLRLPQTADANQIDARFENGVLSVTIQKRPEVQPKQITVKAANGKK